MKEVMSTAIFVVLIVIASNIVEVKNAVVDQKHTLEFELRSLRYGNTIQRATLDCGLSKGATISCVEKMLKCVDKFNSLAGEFDYELSYFLCKKQEVKE